MIQVQHCSNSRCCLDMASAQVLYYLVFRLHINLMQLFVCKNTGTVKHSGTKFNVIAIICNSKPSIYCADLSSTWSTKEKAKIVTLYKWFLQTKTISLKKTSLIKNSHCSIQTLRVTVGRLTFLHGTCFCMRCISVLETG